MIRRVINIHPERERVGFLWRRNNNIKSFNILATIHNIIKFIFFVCVILNCLYVKKKERERDREI
jgi:hypothetical protein